MPSSVPSLLSLALCVSAVVVSMTRSEAEHSPASDLHFPDVVCPFPGRESPSLSFSRENAPPPDFPFPPSDFVSPSGIRDVAGGGVSRKEEEEKQLQGGHLLAEESSGKKKKAGTYT